MHLVSGLPSMKKIFSTILLSSLTLFLTCQLAFAHAVLVSSSPKANETVHGPTITVDLKFNSHVDGLRSRLTLVRPDGKTDALTLSEQSSNNELSATAKQLTPGKYVVRWQALAVDGHMTRGEIPFTVE
jgi:copper resistance protein C